MGQNPAQGSKHMTVIGLAQSNIIKPIQRAKHKTSRFLAMVLIFAIGISIFLYVLQVNSISTKDYTIREFKIQISELENRNKLLQIDVSNLKSINGLQTRTEDFHMVVAKEIEYVNLSMINNVAIK